MNIWRKRPNQDDFSLSTYVIEVKTTASTDKCETEFEEEEEGGSGGEMFLVLLAVGGFLALAAFLVIPMFFGSRHRQGPLTACKSNLKNLGTAMEMYSTDWSGRYPQNPAVQLVPNYLKTLPECPAAGTDTYSSTFELGPKATYNTRSFEDYYFVYCRGNHHSNVGIPVNYPQYNGMMGLVER